MREARPAQAPRRRPDPLLSTLGAGGGLSLNRKPSGQVAAEQRPRQERDPRHPGAKQRQQPLAWPRSRPLRCRRPAAGRRPPHDPAPPSCLPRGHPPHGLTCPGRPKGPSTWSHAQEPGRLALSLRVATPSTLLGPVWPWLWPPGDPTLQDGPRGSCSLVRAGCTRNPARAGDPRPREVGVQPRPPPHTQTRQEALVTPTGSHGAQERQRRKCRPPECGWKTDV